jgi:hypothetical protein
MTTCKPDEIHMSRCRLPCCRLHSTHNCSGWWCQAQTGSTFLLACLVRDLHSTKTSLIWDSFQSMLGTFGTVQHRMLPTNFPSSRLFFRVVAFRLSIIIVRPVVRWAPWYKKSQNPTVKKQGNCIKTINISYGYVSS